MIDGIARARTRSRDRLGPSPADTLIGRTPTPSLAAPDATRRTSRLLLLRTVVVVVVAGLAIWLGVSGPAEAPPGTAVWFQCGLVVATCLSSIAFGLLLRRGTDARRLVWPMQIVDLCVTSLLVYVTGGAQSPFTFLFPLSIVGAGALAFRRGAIVVTVASLVLMAGVVLLAWTRGLPLAMSPQVHPWQEAAGDVVRAIGVNAAAYLGVGVLAVFFGDQLQRGEQTLATTRAQAADLMTLHDDIVRSLPSGLITVGTEGAILTANQAAADILRQDAGELRGRPIEDVMPGLPTGDARREDLVLGPELTIGVTTSPLRDVRERVIGRVVNFQDLTELRRLESQSRRSERLATVGQLAAGVAHEIRNPLASISGSIELLRQAPGATDEDRTLMAIVHREVQRLNVLIGDLLDYANPRAAQAVDFDLAVLVEETLRVAGADAAFSAVSLSHAVEGELRLHADPAKLRQVLWNLLRNAADAAAAGGGHVRVDVYADTDDPASDEAKQVNVVFAVADDGPGIPAEQVARIFDPFFTTKAKGTGLGLATCHAIVAEHRGHIDVQSEVGRGTKMIVSLPRG
ncbi:MAG TPA: ATP-binding protein [Kofleriaceae bacterium]|jgi:two-component system sensor histidine kinase PilS (NtrC family)